MRSGHKKKSSSIDPDLNAFCETRLGSRIKRVEYPGGRSRESNRLLLKNGRSVIVTKRKNKENANIEKRILLGMTDQGAPVPPILAHDGVMLVVRDLGNRRLSTALHEADDQLRKDLLNNALSGLSTIHRAADKLNLESTLPLLGAKNDWINEFIDRPKILGHHFKIPAPSLDEKRILKLLKVRKPRFVKWDARPGNALVDDSNQVYWIDWEHCGVRNRLDDMVWLLADEYVNDNPVWEVELMNQWIEQFADDLNDQQAREYFLTYGVLHSMVRLGLILSRKKSKEWWDPDYCLKGDKIGVFKLAAERLCRRSGRWSEEAPLLKTLSPWLLQITEKISAL